ncbi:response regulator transcription factor [Variovorax rhizosphaerae]|uniref:Response regulator transcription factor n=1 Tax=Variovorax rhizosphaerae TaxID=1836200 RepID=A0ABU8X0A8_9BURK
MVSASLLLPSGIDGFISVLQLAPAEFPVRDASTRIGIVDDYSLGREALRRLLRDHEEFSVVGEARNAREALQLVDSLLMQVLILDLSMPGKSGLDNPRLDSIARPRLVPACFQRVCGSPLCEEGAQGRGAWFCAQGERSWRAHPCASAHSRGGRYVSPALARQFALEVSEREVTSHARLSKREFQVLLGIAAGRKRAAIATQLGLSPKTVTLYRAHLLHKLGLTTNTELTCFAIKEGLLA